MATNTTKKPNTPAADNPVVARSFDEIMAENTAPDTPSVAAAPNDGYVVIDVPKGANDDEPNLFIGVNGVNYVLPKGKKHRVPAHVAAEYERSKKAQEIRDANMEAMLEASQQ